MPPIPAQFAYSRSATIELNGEESDPFYVPSGFAGHLYICGDGGDQQAVFVIGSDGNARFEPGVGFKTKLGESANLAGVDVVWVEALSWKIVSATSDVPKDTGPTKHVTRIHIALIGMTRDVLPSLVHVGGYPAL